MQVGLNEEPKLKIARFIKGLSPSIASKVELQPYLCFDDVYHLVIKVEKQLEGRKPFQTTSSIRASSPPIKLSLPLHPLELLTRVKGLLVGHQRDWRIKSVSNVTVMDTSKWIILTEGPSPLEK